MIWIYDFEVFKYDWVVVFENVKTKQFEVFHNNPVGLRGFMNQTDIYCGFNSKNYDQFIMKAIMCGADNKMVKNINDWCISGKSGYEHWFIRQNVYYFNNIDIMDDMQMGLSLKAIEGHLGMNIQETEVDFDLDRPLTEDELRSTIYYCKHDVESTLEVFNLRKDYLNTKITLGATKNLKPEKALSMTNAKLTAIYLDAKPKKFNDAREYVFPDKLKLEYIPKEIIDFFMQIRDTSIPDEELWKKSLSFFIGDCECKVAWGGVHGAIPHHDESETEEYILVNLDVGSFYPHLMTLFGYCSRCMEDPTVYDRMLEQRMIAKKTGDKKTANALKLVANTTYGATLNQYNALYDPLKARSVCVSGQLFLLELTYHAVQECPSIKVLQLNTDGVMMSIKRSEYAKLCEIRKEWETRTGFELEEDKIQRIIQKDVNNYIEVAKDGKYKIKGGYLVRGIAPAGAFNINNNATIVATALIEYLTKGTKPEVTIGECMDLSKFQLIAKAGVKYRDAYQVVDGKNVKIQRVNRVYATADARYGTIGKVKVDELGEEHSAKIGNLPEHCLVDNDNHCNIKDIDKQWYIDLTYKRINDFRGVA